MGNIHYPCKSYVEERFRSVSAAQPRIILPRRYAYARLTTDTALSSDLTSMTLSWYLETPVLATGLQQSQRPEDLFKQDVLPAWIRSRVFAANAIARRTSCS